MCSVNAEEFKLTLTNCSRLSFQVASITEMLYLQANYRYADI